MAWILDLILLLTVSGLLASKVLYLGVIVLMIGLLIGFQNRRMENLLGTDDGIVTSGRKIRAAILSFLIGLTIYPLVGENVKLNLAVESNAENLMEMLLPVSVTIGMLVALAMVVLSIEKRKR